MCKARWRLHLVLSLTVLPNPSPRHVIPDAIDHEYRETIISVTTTKPVFICPWRKTRRIRARSILSAKSSRFRKSVVSIIGMNVAPPEAVDRGGIHPGRAMSSMAGHNPSNEQRQEFQRTLIEIRPLSISSFFLMLPLATEK